MSIFKKVLFVFIASIFSLQALSATQCPTCKTEIHLATEVIEIPSCGHNIHIPCVRKYYQTHAPKCLHPQCTTPLDAQWLTRFMKCSAQELINQQATKLVPISISNDVEKLTKDVTQKQQKLRLQYDLLMFAHKELKELTAETFDDNPTKHVYIVDHKTFAYIFYIGPYLNLHGLKVYINNSFEITLCNQMTYQGIYKKNVKVAWEKPEKLLTAFS